MLLSRGRFMRICLPLCLSCLGGSAATSFAQVRPVTLQVEVVKQAKSGPGTSTGSAADVAVWLVPLGHDGKPALSPSGSRTVPRLVQRNKSFIPHVLVVQTGSEVQFPNEDPFFHNVFSLFDGKRFDLGLYESGSSRAVRFERTGVSFLFCNIHPDMSAAVVSVDTPYFGVSGPSGQVAIAGVPGGAYRLEVWYERSSPEALKALGREVSISDSARDLGTIRVTDNAGYKLDHKNMYGQDYVPPPAGNPSYR